MGIDLGSLATGEATGTGLFDKNGVVGLVSTMLGWMKNFADGLGYFTGDDFQKAVAGGFMK